MASVEERTSSTPFFKTMMNDLSREAWAKAGGDVTLAVQYYFTGIQNLVRNAAMRGVQQEASAMMSTASSGARWSSTEARTKLKKLEIEASEYEREQMGATIRVVAGLNSLGALVATGFKAYQARAAQSPDDTPKTQQDIALEVANEGVKRFKDGTASEELMPGFGQDVAKTMSLGEAPTELVEPPSPRGPQLPSPGDLALDQKAEGQRPLQDEIGSESIASGQTSSAPSGQALIGLGAESSEDILRGELQDKAMQARKKVEEGNLQLTIEDLYGPEWVNTLFSEMNLFNPKAVEVGATGTYPSNLSMDAVGSESWKPSPGNLGGE